MRYTRKKRSCTPFCRLRLCDSLRIDKIYSCHHCRNIQPHSPNNHTPFHLNQRCCHNSSHLHRVYISHKRIPLRRNPFFPFRHILSGNVPCNYHPLESFQTTPPDKVHNNYPRPNWHAAFDRMGILNIPLLRF